MNLYKNDDQEYVWADLCPLGYWEVAYVFEGDLPESMSDEEVDAWLNSKYTRIIEGQWAGPFPDQVGGES